MMRLGTVLTPMSDENLTLAAQCGVTDVVGRYPGTNLEDLLRLRDRIESFGMRLAVIEGYLPIENIKVGRDDGSEIAAMKTLIRNMRQAGISRLCYNFMAGTDWVRTQLDELPERAGGAKSNRVPIWPDVEQAMSLSGNASTAISPDVRHHCRRIVAKPDRLTAGIDPRGRRDGRDDVHAPGRSAAAAVAR